MGMKVSGNRGSFLGTGKDRLRDHQGRRGHAALQRDPAADAALKNVAEALAASGIGIDDILAAIELKFSRHEQSSLETERSVGTNRHQVPVISSSRFEGGRL